MARLAGILSPQKRLETVSLGSQMLNSLRTDSAWQIQSEELPQGFLGWLGPGKANLYRGGGIVLAMDGVIYNRSEFGNKECDAEILCDLYRQYGFKESLRRLNGDFALALFDERKKVLYLSRDRFGVKPLYYVSKPGFFAFASRLCGLLTLPGVEKELNREFVALFAASHYRCFDHHPEHSPFAEIAQLPPSEILIYCDGKLSKEVYWTLTDLPDFSEPEEALAERYRDLFLDAVSLRLKSARRPAFALSGGMDSSSVLASAVHLSGEKQNVFSCVYTDETFDETNEIKSMLETNALKWWPIRVDRPDVFQIVDEMISFHDEPVTTATWLSHYLMCRAAKEAGFGGLFGGLGGDELNAGEYEYYFSYFADLRLKGQEDQLKHEVSLWAKYHDHPIYRKNVEVMEKGLEELVDLSVPGQCLVPERRLKRYFHVLNPDYFDFTGYTLSPLKGPFRNYLRNRTYQDLTRETAPCSLRAEDRQTSAFGLGHFLPFFDHRLAEFMFRVPIHFQIQRGITKHLLRKAMQGILPEETRTRIKKTGWNAPAHLWFATSARESLLDLVRSKKFRERGIYRIPEVERLIAEHCDIVQSGRNEENHMMFLWQLVNLELWFQRYIDRSD